ncbi:hypothetical protein ACFYV7_28735 [Nocardia suismassiliense]|uniref:Uncharacterized protein n=1 Tax=Nocardia suismassiliense TaxID=2077092 RepID=A0ABW6QZW9_9NOCA
MKTWRDLDSATRKALLRGEPATDPEIDRIAVAHAEKVLNRSQVRGVLVGLVGGTAMGLLLGTLMVVAGLPFGVFLVVVIVLAIGVMFVMARRKLALIRLLNVSRGVAREPVLPGSAEKLQIRITVLGAVRIAGPYLFIVAVLLLVGVLWTNPWLIGAAAVVSVPVLAYTGYLLAWALPKHPAAVLDASGVHTPRMGLSVGWESFTEISVVPLRASARDTRQVIVFMLHDDQVYLRQLPSWQAFVARMNKKTYLSPLVIVDAMVDKSASEIAAAAAALSGLPVTRAAQGVREPS